MERGEGGEDMEEIDEPRVLRRLIAAAADMRRPLDEGERSDEPRMRWLYLAGMMSTETLRAGGRCMD